MIPKRFSTTFAKFPATKSRPLILALAIGTYYVLNQSEPELPKTKLFKDISVRSIFETKRTSELFSSFLSLQLCRMSDIAIPAMKVMDTFNLYFLLRKTLLSHFCAGESLEDAIPALQNLQRRKMVPILDVSIESDLNGTVDPKNIKRFQESLVCASNIQGASVAIKVTALCSPQVLLRMSKLISKNRLRFHELDEQKLLQMVPLEDVAEIKTLFSNLNLLCAEAKERNIALMIDAEQSYFQDAIDFTAYRMSVLYNTAQPIVFNTYQMYLKNGLQKLKTDLEWSNKLNVYFGAKIVRGAYLVQEQKNNVCFDKIEDTHQSYNTGINHVLNSIHKGQRAKCVIASHNVDSVNMAVQQVQDLKIPKSQVMFAQLMGMQEATSYALTKNQFPTFKYMPYGKIHEVLPYLIRRAQENSSLMGSAKLDRELLWYEISCRIKETIK